MYYIVVFFINIWENVKFNKNNFENIYVDIFNYVIMWVLEIN